MAAPRAHCREIIVGKLPGDNAVAAITGASVLVCARGTSAPIAQTIYAAATGGTTLANPLSSDASGIVEFWVPVEQTVDLIITIQGFGSQTVTCECLVALESGAVNLNTTQALANPGDVMISTESLTWQGAASAHTAVSLDQTQVLTNKTLTAPVIATISNAGRTITVPAADDTLVGKATTDTLTNKTLTAPTLTGAGSITVNGGGFVNLGGASVNGGFDLPGAAGAAPTVDTQMSFDTTAHRPVIGSNGLTLMLATFTGTETLTNKTLTAPTITGAASVTSTGATDLSGAASETTKVLDLVFVDEVAPAAPGANKTALYTVAGVPHYRAGAAGADTSLSPTTNTIMLALSTGNTAVPNGATMFVGQGVDNAAEVEMKFPMPIAYSFTKLYAQLDGTVAGAAETVVITLRKAGVDQTITLTINSGASIGNDTAHSVAFAAGDLLSLKWVSSAGASALTGRFMLA